MLISREKTDLIEGTPMGFKIYEAVHERRIFTATVWKLCSASEAISTSELHTRS